MDQIEIKFICDNIEPVNMAFPKTTKIEDALIQFLKKTNSIIELNPENISFVHGPIILNRPENLKKSLFGIFKPKDRRKIVKVFDYGGIKGGGGCFGVPTIDVSKNKTENIGFSKSGKHYRLVRYGLNIQSKCKNSNCIAYKDTIYVQIGFVKNWNLVYKHDTIVCPECKEKVMPLNFGFFNCKYEIEYEKIENEDYIDGKVNGSSGENEFIVFKEYSCGKATFSKLIFNITK